MGPRLGLWRQAVLDECDLVLIAAVGQPGGHELGGRAAGELAEVAVEVRLVVVAAVERDLGQRAAARTHELACRVAEAQDAGERLRREADRPAEARGEVAPAP